MATASAKTRCNMMEFLPRTGSDARLFPDHLDIEEVHRIDNMHVGNTPSSYHQFDG